VGNGERMGKGREETKGKGKEGGCEVEFHHFFTPVLINDCDKQTLTIQLQK